MMQPSEVMIQEEQPYMLGLTCREGVCGDTYHQMVCIACKGG
jgi:hypothetical protein